MRFVIYLLLGAVLLQGCSEALVGNRQQEDMRLADFEKTWSVFNEWYPYFTFKGIDWDSIHAVYYPRILDSYADDYLPVIGQMLRELKDGHVYLKLRNGKVYSYRTPRQLKDAKLYDFEVTRTYLDDDTVVGNLPYGHIGDVGYIRIPAFSGFGLNAVNTVFRALAGSQGMIIDVRHNGGGSTDLAIPFVAKCIPKPLWTPGWIERGVYSPGPTLRPDTVNNFTGPVVVLVDGVTFSSSEHFAMWMQHTGHATLVGDTTGGGSGNPFLFALPSRNVIRDQYPLFLPVRQPAGGMERH